MAITSILLLTLISGLLFLCFLWAFISGLIQKNKRRLRNSAFIFIAFFATAIFTGYQFFSKSYIKLSQIFRPRTGEEIYTALWGEPRQNCVKLLEYQDQVIPKLDYAIYLHFTTCADELKRILSRENYTADTLSTKGWHTNEPSPNNDWFKPERLGDTVLMYKYEIDETGNGQTIYTNRELTEAYCIDILD